jgi:hypothetical protein
VVDGSERWPSSRWRDGQEWLLGAEPDVEWIAASTTVGLKITSAIPPVFGSYATILVPNEYEDRLLDLHLLLDLLGEQWSGQSWWLGYLDTGSDDVVFPDAPRVALYAGWRYVLVKAGKEQAARWRDDQRSWRGPGPDLIFPVDRSWLLSRLWDDDWRCFGGPSRLVENLLGEHRLKVRQVELDEDATPPGHVAY